MIDAGLMAELDGLREVNQTLRDLVGDVQYGAEAWAGCSRQEVIRQFDEVAADRDKWQKLFEQVKRERDAALRERDEIDRQLDLAKADDEIWSRERREARAERIRLKAKCDLLATAAVDNGRHMLKKVMDALADEGAIRAWYAEVVDYDAERVRTPWDWMAVARAYLADWASKP